MGILGNGLLQLGEVAVERHIVEADWVWLVNKLVGGVDHHKIIVRLRPRFQERRQTVGSKFLVGVGVEKDYLIFLD